MGMDIEDLRARLEGMPPAALAQLRDRLAEKAHEKRQAMWHPYPWQIPPGEVPAMGAWALLGGRGTGKTDAGARYVLDHIDGPPCDRRVTGGHRVAIVGPTLGDAVESAVNGVSGIRTHDPRVALKTTEGGTHLLFPNGSRGKIFGTNTIDAIERLRSGGNRCLFWFEEAAAMRYLDEAIAHSRMGLRIGKRPHYIITTTPKPRAAIIRIAESPKTLVSRGKTAEAYHLPPETRESLIEEYGGTHLGRQELDGEILTEIKGAMVTRAVMDSSRVASAPALDLTVVAVDPNGTGERDEFGIAVMGRGAADRHAYVLADWSTQDTGLSAARRAWQAFDEHDADVMVYEDVFGKAWLTQVLTDAWNERYKDPDGNWSADWPEHVRLPPPMKTVKCGSGKSLRAQPCAVRWEQGRVHLVGTHDALETQWATWVPQETKDSPDRVDAMVHGEAYIRGRDKRSGSVAIPQGRLG